MERILKTKKVHTLMVLALISMFVLVMSACKESPPKVLTVEQIADSHIAFNSVINDRSGIVTGKFFRFPWEGDKFILSTNLLPEIKQSTERIAPKVSRDGREVSVKTVTEYWVELSEFGNSPIFGPPVTRDVMVKWGGAEIPVPVKIRVIVLRPSYISEKTAQAIRDLPDGKLNEWELRASDFLGYNSLDDQYYPNFEQYLEHRAVPEQLLIGDLSHLTELLPILLAISKNSVGDATRKTYERILFANAEYQTLEQRNWEALSSSEKIRRHELWNKAFEQARELHPYPVFDPKTALEDYVFILPVTVQAIDGIKIESPD